MTSGRGRSVQVILVLFLVTMDENAQYYQQEYRPATGASCTYYDVVVSVIFSFFHWKNRNNTPLCVYNDL